MGSGHLQHAAVIASCHPPPTPHPPHAISDVYVKADHMLCFPKLFPTSASVLSRFLETCSQIVGAYANYRCTFLKKKLLLCAAVVQITPFGAVYTPRAVNRLCAAVAVSTTDSVCVNSPRYQGEAVVRRSRHFAAFSPCFQHLGP